MSSPKRTVTKPRVDLSTSLRQSSDQDKTALCDSDIDYSKPENLPASAHQSSNQDEDSQPKDEFGEIMDYLTDAIIVPKENCGPCQAKTNNQVNEANWFCQDCDDLLCHDCMSYHKIFKPTRNHRLTSLHPPCGNCEGKRSSVESNFFCNECMQFLCDDCRSFHQLLKITETHDIVRSQERVKSQNKKDPEPVVAESTAGNKESAAGRFQAQKERGQIRKEDRKEREQDTDAINSKFHRVLDNTTQTSSADTNTGSVRVPFSKRTATFATEFDVQVPGDRTTPWIRGSAFLPNSKLLLVDGDNKKLKLFDVNYKFVTHKQFSGDLLRDVSVYDSSEVAVRLGSNILRMSVDADVIKETGKISPKFTCYGVSYINKDKLALTGVEESWLWNRDILCVYDTAGKRLSILNLGQGGNIPYHVTVDEVKSTAYVSTAETKTVSSVDLVTNKVVFTYKHKDLSGPHGLAVDQNHNFYVCGCQSHNVHQVSPAGDYIQTLLSKKDGLDYPQTLSFMPDRDTFILGMGGGARHWKTVQVYKML